MSFLQCPQRFSVRGRPQGSPPHTTPLPPLLCLRMRFALKGRRFAQNVDKSGKIVDNRLKMCKSTFEIYAHVLPVSYEMQVLYTLWVVGDYLWRSNVF